MNHNNDDKRTCPCKRLPLALSSLTGAELGDLHSLRRHNRNVITKKQDSAGNTPLHLAAQHGHVAATAVLLEAGCDVNAHDGGATPLHRASFAGAVATMRLLLEKPQCDLFLPDTSFGDGMTALHKAASGGRYLAVQLLLTVHAQRGTLTRSLNAIDSYNQTPIQVARSRIAQQAQEQKSVARWDAIAGGVANWTLCTQILQRAAQDGSVLNAQQIEDLPASILTQNNSDDCADCVAGECTTKSWEEAFARGLMQAITKQPLSREMLQGDSHVVGDSTTREPLEPTNVPNSLEKHESGTTKDSDQALAGRPCNACHHQSLFLYPVAGVLLCRACKRGKKKDS